MFLNAAFQFSGQELGARGKSAEHDSAALAKFSATWGFASRCQKPESGPDLSAPADFLKANYCPGTSMSLRVRSGGPDTAPVTPLSTHGVRQETEAQQEKDVQPNTAPDSEPAWWPPEPTPACLHTQCPLHPPVKRSLSCLVPSVPACLLFFRENISGPVLFSLQSIQDKAPLTDRGRIVGPALVPSSSPRINSFTLSSYEFLPCSYLS